MGFANITIIVLVEIIDAIKSIVIEFSDGNFLSWIITPSDTYIFEFRITLKLKNIQYMLKY